MEARDYIDKFKELVQEYKDNNYLVERFNTFEINPFTNYSVDDVPLESGYVNISSYYEKAWDDAISRKISTINGDITASDIILLAGDPGASTYYVKYEDTIITPNITSYGTPISNVQASIGNLYLDLTPNRVFSGGKLVAEYHSLYKKVKQDDDTAWELVTDKCLVFQSNRLRYTDIDTSKYYWDMAEHTLYKLDENADTIRSPWVRYTYKVYGVSGNPTYLPYELIRDIVDRYFFDRTEAETKLYKFNTDTMEWQTIGDIVNYALTESPSEVSVVDGVIQPPESITLETSNKESYYCFIPTDGFVKIAEKESEYNNSVDEKTSVEEQYHEAEVNYNEAVEAYNNAIEISERYPTQENIEARESAYRYTVEKQAESNLLRTRLAGLNAQINHTRNEIDQMSTRLYNDGVLYTYDYTVFLTRINVEETFYESAFAFYNNLMHVYTDINDLDRIDHKKFYLTDGHPGKKVLQPDLDRIYLDTKNQKIYRPLKDGFKETEEPKDGTLPIEVTSLKELDLYFNAVYKVGDTYYKYNPYEEMLQEHFYFDCGVFF